MHDCGGGVPTWMELPDDDMLRDFNPNWLDADSSRRNRERRLLRSVMAMMGKFVLSVNTGKSDRKYWSTGMRGMIELPVSLFGCMRGEKKHSTKVK